MEWNGMNLAEVAWILYERKVCGFLATTAGCVTYKSNEQSQ